MELEYTKWVELEYTKWVEYTRWMELEYNKWGHSVSGVHSVEYTQLGGAGIYSVGRLGVHSGVELKYTQ